MLTFLFFNDIISLVFQRKKARGSAGIGRQARLRILWVYARVGSSPISRIQRKGQKALILFRFSAFFIVWMIRFLSHAVSRFWVVGLLYLVVAVGRIKPVGLFVRCWFGWKCNVLMLYSIHTNTFHLNICSQYDTLHLYNWIESRMWFSDYLMPSDLTKGGWCPMNTMEVLTLLLVVFEALSYIDNQKKHKHKKKRKMKNKKK